MSTAASLTADLAVPQPKVNPWIIGIAVSLAIVGLVLKADESNVASGTFFYVFISVLNLFIVSVFWSFLLELFTREGVGTEIVL